ncbi:MAG: FAD-binding protein [Bacteroidia bacterium]|nr:FAD-binding protein [Bacteroidia bacterium]GIV23573.1 MAG: FAD-binding oxidoreductase [Bacteroidia bacterium]
MRVRNWGRTVAIQPTVYAEPTNEEEIVRWVQQAAKKKHTLRVIGAGHSWPPLADTKGILLRLDRMQGLISVSPTQHTATLWAGTRLYRALPLLWKEGFSLSNQGDIDRQSIAGAFSTGTHGTGKAFGILATQAVHYRFVDGEGRIHDVYADTQPALFRALQVSLGLLGVITQVTLRVEPRFYLRLTKKLYPLEEALQRSEEWLERYRHFEFFWFPYSEKAAVKLSEKSTEAGQVSFLRRWFIDALWENGAFWAVNKFAQFLPSASPALCRFAGRSMSEEVRVDKAYRIFASPRWVRFREMEYGVPAAAGPEVLREIRRWIEKHQPAVSFPIEYRYVRGDDIPLSPAYGEDRVFIAVHAYYRMPYAEFFRGIEEIFQAYGGRPHWGKMHTASAEYIAQQYPQLSTFLALQAQYDSHGVFRTPYLQALLWGERISAGA